MTLRLAYFSPLPPARTGIADYSRELLPALAQQADLTLYVAQPEAVDPDLRGQFPIRPLSTYPAQRWEHDLALYHLGNSDHHDALYQLFLNHPGIVVLHDYVLHHFIESRTAGRGDMAAYARQLGYELGPAGLAVAADIRRERISSPWYSVPLNRAVVDRAPGLIVHSRFVRDRIMRQRRDRPVAIVPALITPYAAPSLRAQLGWPADAIILASAGQITRSKQIEPALRAFARLRAEMDNIYYLLIGEPLAAEIDLPALLDELELRDVVHCTGYVPDLSEFAGWMAAADIIINLRHPTAGETSATALRALAAGRPLIVFDQGWYSELPDAVCLKIPALDDAALQRAMADLAGSPARRQAMGQQGAIYTTDVHSPAAVAGQYVKALEHLLATIVEKLNA